MHNRKRLAYISINIGVLGSVFWLRLLGASPWIVAIAVLVTAAAMNTVAWLVFRAIRTNQPPLPGLDHEQSQTTRGQRIQLWSGSLVLGLGVVGVALSFHNGIDIVNLCSAAFSVFAGLFFLSQYRKSRLR